jgi:hypothetical protein
MQHPFDNWSLAQIGFALPRDSRKRMLNAVYSGAILPKEFLEGLCDAEDAEEDAGLERPRA